MGKIDGLSRRLDWKIEVDKDNENQVIIEGPEVDIIEKIKKARSKDKEVVRIVEEMKKAGIKVIQGEE